MLRTIILESLLFLGGVKVDLNYALLWQKRKPSLIFAEMFKNEKISLVLENLSLSEVLC